jgi:hypothetical protein
MNDVPHRFNEPEIIRKDITKFTFHVNKGR